jgi:hypothetical protein
MTNRWSALVAVLVACGGGGGAATQSSAVPLPSASTTGVAPLPSGRSPSEALLHAWPGGSNSALFYADVEGLVHTKLLGSLLPNVLASLAATPALLRPDQLTCIREVADAAKELAFGMDGGNVTLVARLEKATPELRSCIDLASVPGLRLGDDGMVVLPPKTSSPGDVSALRALRLVGDERARYRDAHGTDVHLALSEEHLALHAKFDARDDADADSVQKQLSTPPSVWIKGDNVPVSPDDTANIDRIAKSLHVTHDKTHVDLSFDLREAPLDQARDVALVAKVAIQGVRRYLLSVKEIEAEVTVQAIARDFVEAWEREPFPGTTKMSKLRSFPAVPKDVPRGVKYESRADEWKAWDPIKFMMDVPQYYQYEVRAAADGQSADIIAHGDLNGDGKTSTYKITLRVEPKTKHRNVSPYPFRSAA